MSVQERFANPEGRCVLRYFKDGSKVITGGADGDVHVFGAGIDKNDNFEPFLVGDEVLGLAIDSKDRIYVAPKIEPGDKGCNEVLAFKYSENGVADGTIAKFTAEASCVDVDKGMWLMSS